MQTQWAEWFSVAYRSKMHWRHTPSKVRKQKKSTRQSSRSIIYMILMKAPERSFWVLFWKKAKAQICSVLYAQSTGIWITPHWKPVTISVAFSEWALRLNSQSSKQKSWSLYRSWETQFLAWPPYKLKYSVTVPRHRYLAPCQAQGIISSVLPMKPQKLQVLW